MKICVIWKIYQVSRASEHIQANVHHIFSYIYVHKYIMRSGHLTEIRWSVCILKSQKCFCVSFSRTDSGLYIYYLFIWSNLNFWHNSQWITFPTLSCLVLCSFRANFLHSLIIWLIFSSQLQYNLHLLFCLFLL